MIFWVGRVWANKQLFFFGLMLMDAIEIETRIRTTFFTWSLYVQWLPFWFSTMGRKCVFQHFPYIHKQEWMQQREHTGNMWCAFYLGLTLCLLGSVSRCQSIDLHYKTPTSLVHSFFFVYVTEKYRNIPYFLPTLENTVALIWFWYFYDGCTLVQKNTGTSQIFPHVGKKMLLIWFWYFYDRRALQRNVFRCIPILWALLYM